MSPLFSLFLFVLVDVLGFSLVLPLFPYMRREFSMSYTELGWLQASNAIAQLISVPIIGSLSDKYGRKPMLMICVVGTFVSFVMFAMADSVWMLFASRILDGALGGNISLAQAWISDMTSAEERTRGMGLLGAAFGLGFIVGPATGGILASYDRSYPSWIAAGLCLLNLYSLAKFLPESRPKTAAASSTSQFVLGLSTAKEIVRSPRLLCALGLRLGHMVVFTTFEIWFGYVTSDKLGLTARQSSYLLTLYGIVYAMVQATGMRRLVTRFEETGLLAFILHAQACAYAITYFLCSTTFSFGVMMIPLALLAGISNTLVSSLVSKQVSPEHMGGALGVSAALGSLSRIVGPTFTSFLVQNSSLDAPPVMCALISFMLVFAQMMLRRAIREYQKTQAGKTAAQTDDSSTIAQTQQNDNDNVIHSANHRDDNHQSKDNSNSASVQRSIKAE